MIILSCENSITIILSEDKTREHNVNRASGAHADEKEVIASRNAIIERSYLHHPLMDVEYQMWGEEGAFGLSPKFNSHKPPKKKKKRAIRVPKSNFLIH